MMGIEKTVFDTLFTATTTAAAFTGTQANPTYVWQKGDMHITGGSGFGILVIHNEFYDPDIYEVSSPTSPVYNTGSAFYDARADSSKPQYDVSYSPAEFRMNGNCSFTGVIIADQMVRVNGTASTVGALLSLGGINVTGDVTGNWTAKYSCDAIEKALGGFGYGTKIAWHPRAADPERPRARRARALAPRRDAAAAERRLSSRPSSTRPRPRDRDGGRKGGHVALDRRGESGSRRGAAHGGRRAFSGIPDAGPDRAGDRRSADDAGAPDRDGGNRADLPAGRGLGHAVQLLRLQPRQRGPWLLTVDFSSAESGQRVAYAHLQVLVQLAVIALVLDAFLHLLLVAHGGAADPATWSRRRADRRRRSRPPGRAGAPRRAGGSAGGPRADARAAARGARADGAIEELRAMHADWSRRRPSWCAPSVSRRSGRRAPAWRTRSATRSAPSPATSRCCARGDLGPAEAREFLERTERELARVHRIMLDLLDWARPPLLECAPLDLGALARDLARQAGSRRSSPASNCGSIWRRACPRSPRTTTARGRCCSISCSTRPRPCPGGRCHPRHPRGGRPAPRRRIACATPAPASPEVAAHLFEPFVSSRRGPRRHRSRVGDLPPHGRGHGRDDRRRDRGRERDGLHGPLPLPRRPGTRRRRRGRIAAWP